MSQSVQIFILINRSLKSLKQPAWNLKAFNDCSRKQKTRFQWNVIWNILLVSNVENLRNSCRVELKV